MNAASETPSGIHAEAYGPAPMPPQVTVPVADAQSVMAALLAAASDPQTNVDKFERLMLLYERLQKAAAEREFHAAMAEMQPELPIVEEHGGIKDKSKNVQSTYAKWEDINEAIKPILKQYGFALTFRPRNADGKVVVKGVLSHKSGHTEACELELPYDTTGSKNAVQSIGSSVSYGKRYTGGALLNLTSRGADDDGKNGGGGFISEEQQAELAHLLTETGGNQPKFCAHMKVDSLAGIRSTDFERARDTITSVAHLVAEKKKNKEKAET